MSLDYGARLASSVTTTFVPVAVKKVATSTIKVAHELSLYFLLKS